MLSASRFQSGARFSRSHNVLLFLQVPARNPNGNAEQAPSGSHYSFSGKETACRDFGPATVIVNDTCAGCTDKSKGYFGSYSMGVGGPADNFV